MQTSFDTNHNIRVAIGNGLRKDIWTEFQNRYQIKDIVEFYSSTDIPIGFVNIYNHVGAVGRITPLTVCNDNIEIIVQDYSIHYNNAVFYSHVKSICMTTSFH